MRILLSAAFLVAGIAIGGAVPGVSSRIHEILDAVGARNIPFLQATPGMASAPATDEKPHEDADAHGPEPAPLEPNGAGEAHAREGIVRMRPEQVTGQDIKVLKVEGGTLARHLLVSGTITPDTDRVARVPARVVGTVAELRKRLGDAVQKDEIVAVLDSREVADAKSEYLTALVQAELQKINYERQQKLLASQAASEAAFQNARATFLENQLRVDLARQKLSALGLNATEVAAAQKRDEATPNRSSLRLFELRSSLSGRIVERKVDVGTKVGGESDPADLYTVADLSSVWIELSVSTLDLVKVRDGARVAIASGQAGGRHAEGKVVFVSPLLNQETRSARVIVALPNPDLTWRPGTFVTAEVEIARDAVAVRIPKAALQTFEGKRVVFVRTEAGFEKREVELGHSDDEAYEVTAGLKAGEEIAVGNSFLLKAELGKAEAGDND
ncbi:efflux RND transporter periplasmic adaptor subunit [Methylobacterium persicinum]|uniref:Cobalt-zinc-cadmium efflux system membrane fusion protein n=1 Tax=Methylobacterium persicinum TaxID=374426 RepID=A0ABU0HHR8_9HYPH|nr:efflux RND transporter periplasmic adaptor subunit [Methylobacterium persicinum]MDQ0441878.1 cobalt-zinc-cadmium efflux system membrane fusion protein [Methylobacterium persicinum]GJE39110.1 Cobalt-zinc-cadmium resistance protein CzcB [Methylobacterium persicinum]